MTCITADMAVARTRAGDVARRNIPGGTASLDGDGEHGNKCCKDGGLHDFSLKIWFFGALQDIVLGDEIQERIVAK